MSVNVPNALALSTIADGAAIVASDHRNNYSGIQVGVNGLIAMFAAAPTKGDLLVSAGGGAFDRLGVGSNGQVVVADSTQALGMKWGASSGAELAYVEFTGTVTSTSTTFAAGASVVSAGALTFDGATKIRVEVFIPSFLSSTTAANAQVSLADGGAAGTDLGVLGNTTSTNNIPALLVREFTPAAATKTYSVVLWLSAAGTATATAGAGGAGTRLPGFIRIVKV